MKNMFKRVNLTYAFILASAVAVGSVMAAAAPMKPAISIASEKIGEAVHSQPMRGTWISTVYNIDWPQNPRKFGFNAELQRQQFTNMLDKLQVSGMNAVFVQVRPTSDAFYPSERLPWSEWLTGTQGKDPGYDPLLFMIEETHKRGMQFHAWFNPYRVSVHKDLSKLVEGHPAKEHPEWLVKHLDKWLYNPGVPEVRTFIVDSIMEVVHNYQIDGVHLDDYFYPYGGNKQSFNDEHTYFQYNDEQFSNKGDWRRDNVNKFIKALHEQIKAVKPHVRFGISPFGVWRNSSVDPTGSATKALSGYDNLYADCRVWIKNKWVDYIAPQIYWPIGYEKASYDILVDWWVKETAGTGVELYIGHAVYKLANNKDANWASADVLVKQLEFNEKFGDSITGSLFFSAANLVRNTKQVSDRLRQYYDN